MRTLNPRRKRSAQPETESRRPGFRLVALACAGLTLLGGAYQTAFARHDGPTASNHGYPHPRRGDREGGGFIGNLSTAESIAVILVPAAILGAGIYLESQEDDDDDDDDRRPNAAPSTFLLGGNIEADDRAPALPEGERVSKVRLVPGTDSLQPGHGFRVQMEGKSARDGRWYSLTNHPAAQVQSSNASLLKVDGVPGAFGLSVTAPAAVNGQEVALKGTFAPEGGAPLSAETKVRLEVPGGSVASN